MSKANKLSNIVTLDGSKELAKIAKKNMELLKCSNIVQRIRRFQDILIDVLNQVKQVDLAFIDGHHDKNATIKYYNMIRPYLSKNAIIIFDDISWSEGMKEAWNEISKDKNIAKYENLDKLGICYLYSS
jgi:predicted O-methyltransferase YrrM